MNDLSNVDVVTEFGGYEGLRARARSDAEGVTKEVASQFESLFVQMMLKSMRSAKLGDGIFDSQQSDMYNGILDQQLAVDLSKAGGLGLAEMMVRQLSPDYPQARTPVEGKISASDALLDKPKTMPTDALNQSTIGSSKTEAITVVKTQVFDSPRDFVQKLWPHAKAAAKELGVAPEALLAQSALETGWGKSVLKHADGRSSHNLFNIKADGRWMGDRVAKTTLEFREGVPIKEQASFRSYGDYGKSFTDYVSFLKKSARYSNALDKGQKPDDFVQELQDAGYATDPRYADKVSDILKRPEFSEVIASLKLGTGSPIT